jgi:hypothetical protein
MAERFDTGRAAWIGSAIACALLGIGVAIRADYAVGFLALCVLVLGTLRWPGAGVFGILLWVPFEGWALKFLSGSSPLLAVTDVVAAALLLRLMAEISVRDRSGARKSLDWVVFAPVAGFVLVAIASWAVNGNPPIDALYWVRVNLRFIPLALWAYLHPDWPRLVRIAALSLIAQSCIGLLELLGGSTVALFFWPGQYSIGVISTQVDTFASVSGKIVAGTVGHYNQYALLLVLYMSVVAGALMQSHEFGPAWRRAMIGSIGLGVVAVGASQSRQAIAVLLVCLSYWLVSTSRRDEASAQGRWVYAVIGVAVVLGIAGASEFIAMAVGRFGQLSDALFWTEQVARNRGYAVSVVAPRVLSAAPFFGLGPGSFGATFTSDTGPAGAALLALDAVSTRFVGDVGWVSILSQTGLLGVVAWVAQIGWLTRAALSRVLAVHLRSVSLGLALVMGIGLFASSPMIYKSTSAWYWYSYGVVGSAVAASRRRPSEGEGICTESSTLEGTASPAARIVSNLGRSSEEN